MIEFDPILVHGWLRRTAGRFPDKVALIHSDKRWTYAQVDHLSDILALHLIQRGIRRHDRVVIFTDNSPETVFAVYGVLKAGGVFIVVSPTMKANKLRYILDHSGATGLIAPAEKAAIINEALIGGSGPPFLLWTGHKNDIPASLQSCSSFWDDVFSTLPATPISCTDFPRCIDVDLACLIYTSGSTGRPKGVISTHHNMISAARSIIQFIGNEPDDAIVDVLPLSFDYGLYQVIMAFMFGGTILLESSFAFLHPLLTRICEYKITGFPVVPTIVAMLLSLRDLSQYDFSALRYITNTGAALPIEHIRQLRRMLPHVRIYSMFGLTECKRVGYLPPEYLDQYPASVGKAMPNCETFLLDNKGNELPPGHIGELVVRGSNVMQGYCKSDEPTERSFQPGQYPQDRRLYSGDYFQKDENNFLYFVGRKDDMIKSKGERVSPREIEDVLCQIKGVAEAAVIGVPDAVQGQAIKAYVAPQDTARPSKRKILEYCAKNLESFMVPQEVEICGRLPRTPNGKIDKKRLANQSVVSCKNTNS
ncbi:MAG: AMP-binding protein [Sedimentisphaerales bacterium]|nr:AMP-binding protein [Sedimentisphaerales bacterium]